MLIRPDVIWKKKYHVHCITSISPGYTPIHGIINKPEVNAPPPTNGGMWHCISYANGIQHIRGAMWEMELFNKLRFCMFRKYCKEAKALQINMTLKWSYIPSTRTHTHPSQHTHIHKGERTRIKTMWISTKVICTSESNLLILPWIVYVLCYGVYKLKMR